MKLNIRKYIPGWEWFFLFAVVVVLALFVLGYDWLGLNGLLSASVALGGAVATTLAAFVMAALIGPLIALITTLLAGLIASVSLVVGVLITPIVALATGLFSTVVSWLAATWVGALFSPVYGMVAPIILKISPLLTLSKYGRKLYDWLDDQPWWPTKLVFTANKQAQKIEKVAEDLIQPPAAKPAPKRAARKPRRR